MEIILLAGLLIYWLIWEYANAQPSHDGRK